MRWNGTSSSLAHEQSTTATPCSRSMAKSSPEIALVALGESTMPLNRSWSDRLRRSPWRWSLRPVHRLASHCSKSHIASGGSSLASSDGATAVCSSCAPTRMSPKSSRRGFEPSPVLRAVFPEGLALYATLVLPFFFIWLVWRMVTLAKPATKMKLWLVWAALLAATAGVAGRTEASLSVEVLPPASNRSEQDVSFVGTISGELHALNSHTGEVLWSTDVGGSLVRSFQSSEARTHGFIVPGEDGSLFTMIDGSLYQYPYSVADFVTQSPLFHDNGMHPQSIFGSKFETVYQIDRETGKVVGSLGFNSPPEGKEASLLTNQPSLLTVVRHEYRVRAFDQITHREVWNLTFAELTSSSAEDDQKQLNELVLQQAVVKWKSPVSMLSKSSKASHLVKLYYDTDLPASLNQLLLSDGRVQWYVGKQRYSSDQPQGGGSAAGALVPVVDLPVLEQPVQRYTQGDFVSQSANISQPNLADTFDASLPTEIYYLVALTVFSIVVALALIAKLAPQPQLFSPPHLPVLPLSVDPTSSPTSPGRGEETLGRIQVFPDKIKGYGANGTIVLEGKFENRNVAVKRMQRALHGSDSSAVKEINFLIQSEGHPNVVRYFAREETLDFFFLALELCDMTLEQAMRDSPPTAFNQHAVPDSTRAFLAQLASATRHLHQLGIVHCDIKAQNVLVCRRHAASTGKPHQVWQSWTPKLSDMGLSRRVETSMFPNAASFVSAASTNHVIGLGTVGWRAPELLGSNKTKISRSLDVFSLGCLFFYILHGTHPFGTDLLALETLIVKGDAVELRTNPSILPETKGLVAQMIAHQPDSRLSSLSVLHDPFLWPSKLRLEFVCLVSNRLEREDPNSLLIKSFEGLGERVFATTSWVYLLESDALRQDVLSNKKRKYDLNSLRDLLRYIRNKHHHFDEDPHLAKVLSPDPEEFLRVFTSCFPNLLPSLVVWVFSHPSVAKEDKFAAMLGGEPVCKERHLLLLLGGGGDESHSLLLLEASEGEHSGLLVVVETERAWFPAVWQPDETKPQAPPPASNFKTNLCLHFEREQRCAMGTKCGFAHGRIELRSADGALVLPLCEQELKKFRAATTPQRKKKV